MLDPDQLVLCEHDREPRECPLCGGGPLDEPFEAVFDPRVWVERHLAGARDADEFPDELAGVPFS